MAPVNQMFARMFPSFPSNLYIYFSIAVLKYRTFNERMFVIFLNFEFLTLLQRIIYLSLLVTNSNAIIHFLEAKYFSSLYS